MEKYKHIAVIVISTTKTEDEINEYKKFDILDYVVKPSTYEGYIKVAENIKAKALL